jgi:ATP-dependent DNA helicase RecQ
MEQDMEHGGLHLTPQSWVVFRGEEKVFGRLPVREPETKVSAKKKSFVTEYNHALFDLLRQKRLEIARSLDVPPFVIFADRSLAEMASAYPRTRENLLGIHGVGKVKCDKYGEAFTDIIEEYCMAKGIDGSLPAESEAEAAEKKPDRSKRYQEVGTMYNNGKSIADITEFFGVKPETVLGHLIRYHADGHLLRPDGLLEASSLSKDGVDDVIKAFEAVGAEFLKPVFEKLNGGVSYEELKLLRLYFHCATENATGSGGG